MPKTSANGSVQSPPRGQSASQNKGPLMIIHEKHRSLVNQHESWVSHASRYFAVRFSAAVRYDAGFPGKSTVTVCLVGEDDVYPFREVCRSTIDRLRDTKQAFSSCFTIFQGQSEAARARMMEAVAGDLTLPTTLFCGTASSVGQTLKVLSKMYSQAREDHCALQQQLLSQQLVSQAAVKAALLAADVSDLDCELLCKCFATLGAVAGVSVDEILARSPIAQAAAQDIAALFSAEPGSVDFAPDHRNHPAVAAGGATEGIIIASADLDNSGHAMSDRGATTAVATTAGHVEGGDVTDQLSVNPPWAEETGDEDEAWVIEKVAPDSALSGIDMDRAGDDGEFRVKRERGFWQPPAPVLTQIPQLLPAQDPLPSFPSAAAAPLSPVAQSGDAGREDTGVEDGTGDRAWGVFPAARLWELQHAGKDASHDASQQRHADEHRTPSQTHRSGLALTGGAPAASIAASGAGYEDGEDEVMPELQPSPRITDAHELPAAAAGPAPYAPPQASYRQGVWASGVEGAGGAAGGDLDGWPGQRYHHGYPHDHSVVPHYQQQYSYYRNAGAHQHQMHPHEFASNHASQYPGALAGYGSHAAGAHAGLVTPRALGAYRDTAYPAESIAPFYGQPAPHASLAGYDAQGGHRRQLSEPVIHSAGAGPGAPALWGDVRGQQKLLHQHQQRAGQQPASTLIAAAPHFRPAAAPPGSAGRGSLSLTNRLLAARGGLGARSGLGARGGRAQGSGCGLGSTAAQMVSTTVPPSPVSFAARYTSVERTALRQEASGKVGSQEPAAVCIEHTPGGWTR